MARVRDDVRAVLLVEDNPADVLLAKRAFAAHGGSHQLTVAQSGQDALDLLRQDALDAGGRAPWGVILLDLNLPDLDGHELLRILRADPRTAFVPVVMLSTSDEASDIRQSYLLGANGYVCKPVRLEEFTRSMDDLLAYWLHWNRAANSEAAP